MSKKLNPKLDRAIQKVIESADGVATQEAWKGDPRLGWKYDVAVNDLVVDKDDLLNVVREMLALVADVASVCGARGDDDWATYLKFELKDVRSDFADELASAVLYPESWP